MRKNRDRRDFERLLETCLRRFPLSRVHLAVEAGRLDANPVKGPRFSICLRGEARYLVCRDGREEVVRLARGDVVFAAPGARMEAHPEARYLSLGVVFHDNLTRFLLARKVPSPSRDDAGHRFIASFHTPGLLDPDGRGFCEALKRGEERGPDDRLRRAIFNVVALAAIEILHGRHDDPESGKAFFTWEAARRFLHDHLHEPVSRRDVADFLRLHPNHVSRLFTRFAGRSFQDYLAGIRLERARKLLARPGLNVAEVAAACGFADPDYFARRYRETYGRVPSKERKNQRAPGRAKTRRMLHP